MTRTAARRCVTGHQNDLGRFSSITHRDRAASRTHSRPRRAVAGCQGRLDASTRIRSAGRRQGWLVGSRLLASQGGRSGERSLLVQPRRQARVPRVTRRRMGQHRDASARNDITLRLNLRLGVGTHRVLLRCAIIRFLPARTSACVLTSARRNAHESGHPQQNRFLHLGYC